MLEPTPSTILIAADDAGFRRRMGSIFDTTAHDVHEAEEISAALRFIRAQRPAMVITFVREKEDFGVRLCRRIKTDVSLASTIVLQISPEFLANSDDLAIEANCQPDGVFYEPFYPHNFLSYFNALVYSRSCENDLRRKTERYQTLMTATSQVVWSADAAGISRELSDWWKNLTGQNAENASGWGWLEVVHSDDRDRVQLARQHSIDTRTPYTAEYRVAALDNTFHHVAVRCFPVFNSDESFREWVGTITDVTAQKQTEAIFSQQNALLELSHEPVFIWSFESGIVTWNRGCAELYGYSTEESIGRDAQILLQTEISPSAQEMREALEKDGQWTGELRRRTKNGRIVFIESRQVLTTESDGRHFVLESNRDITDRRQAEERYRAFIEQSSEGIWRIEVEPPISVEIPFDRQIELAYERAAIAECNEAMARMYGFESAGELVGTPLSQLFVQTDPANYLYLRRFMESGYRLAEAESHELDLEGRDLYFLNNLVGIVTDNSLVRVWGTQRDVTKRKEAENQMRRSEQQFLTLAAAMPQLVWTADREGNFDYLNEQWQDYFAAAPPQFEREGWRDILHPDDLPDFLDDWKRCLETGAPLEIYLRFQHKSGIYRWQIVRGVPLMNETGTVHKWIGTCTDIHDQREVERALRESEERMALAMRIADMGTWDYNPVTDTLLWSNSHFTMYGYPPSHNGQSAPELWRERVHPEDLARVITEIEAAERDRTLYEGEYRIVRFNDGKTRWVNAAGQHFYDETGATVRFVGVFFDVTERREAEARVRRANERFQIAEEAANGFLYDWDILANKVERSATFSKVLGYAANETSSSADAWQTFIHPEDYEKATRLFYKALETDSRFATEYRVRHKEGHWVHVLDRGIIFRDEDGKPVRVIGSTVDINERKKAEQEREVLMESERRAREEAELANRAKDEFLAVLSHELRTPLNAMYGWARMLSAGTLDEEMKLRAVEVIERNVQLQSKLIEDILDVSRIVSGKIKLEMQRLDLTAIVKSAAEMSRPAANQKQIHLETKFVDDVPLYVNGDSERLQQVLNNLVGNSIKFTPGGGSVSVTLEKRGGQAQIIVKDTGAGIAEDFLPHVFDRFRQADSSSKRKHGGLGLGLAIVKHLVELHDGDVRADSAGEGSGATFTITLPLADNRSADNHLETSPSTFANGGASHDFFVNQRILLVEDDPDAVEFLRIMLEKHGAQVQSFDNANDALEALQNADFDLMLSDVGLPEIDGFEFIERVRQTDGEKFKKLPALAVTAYASAEDRERVIAAGFDGCLAKPVSFDALEAAAKQAVGEKEFYKKTSDSFR